MVLIKSRACHLKLLQIPIFNRGELISGRINALY